MWETGEWEGPVKDATKEAVKALKDYQLPESRSDGILSFRCEAAERQ